MLLSRRVMWVFGLAVGCSADAGIPEAPAVEPLPRPEAVAPDPSALLEIPAGTHRPMLPGKDETETVPVAAFRLESHAVTNAQYLRFVRANPQWRRSFAKRVFVDENYLSHWTGDTGFQRGLEDCPVTNVSWFAARAYAVWLGRRLPTLQEWEFVASASETAAVGSRDPRHNQRILDWYSRVSPPVPPRIRSTFRNFHGAYDMHGLIWEWVENFNTALVTGESRGDSGLERSLFCGAGSIGSADPADYASFMRFAFRSSLEASYTVKNLGFRCAIDSTDAATPPCCEPTPAAEPLPDTSVYQLESVWTDQSSQSVRLREFRGQPAIVAMIFTTCEYACPRMLADLKQIEGKLSAQARRTTRFVLVSFDSERDTPDVLAVYARKHSLDLSRWTLLHGGPSAVRELAAILGVRYKRVPSVGFSHSNIITVLSEDGTAVHRRKGLGGAPEGILIAVEREFKRDRR